MNTRQIELVQQSWKKVLPISDLAASLFYQRLFELDGSLRPLFKGNIEEQGRKLTSMINTVVVNLGNLSALVPAVEDLGRRHVGYGVQAAHYRTVGTALLWALEKGLGKDFTAETKEAWSKAYTILAEVMRSASTETEGTSSVQATAR